MVHRHAKSGPSDLVELTAYQRDQTFPSQLLSQFSPDLLDFDVIEKVRIRGSK